MDVYYSLLLVTLFGIAIGVFTGIVPSLGTFAVLSILYVFMLNWTPLEIFLFYTAFLTVSQYVDAIPAVYIGIPGEISAIPTSHEGRFMSQKSKLYLIKTTAISRAVMCIVALLSTWMLLDYVGQFTILFSANVQVLLFSLAIVGIFLTGQNKWHITLLIMCLGYMIGLIGYNWYLKQNILTFGWSDLHDGLPLMSMAIGLYVIPSLWKHLSSNNTTTVIDQSKNSTLELQNTSVSSITPTVLRSGILGYFLGLIPGTSYILAGNGSYNLEKWLRQRKKLYTKGDVPSAIACETGNSTGALSSLVPLIYFGIPITASEGLIFDLMIKNGAVFQSGDFLIANWIPILFSFLLVLAASLMLSWPLAKHCLRLYTSINIKVLFSILIVLCVGTVVYQGLIENSLLLYVSSLLLATAIGLVLRNHDILPALFVLILQNSIESSIMNFLKINDFIF